MTAPMRLVAVTQRVDIVARPHGPPERRDALDQTWSPFLAAAGCLAVPLPNQVAVALTLFDELPFDGLVLTGGNDLAPLGGDAPERDETETALLAAARVMGRPVIGVCRGMQMLQRAFGTPLEAVSGHRGVEQSLSIAGSRQTKASFHAWGARTATAPLEVWARSDDGVVKAVRHTDEPLIGIMWHPERVAPFDPSDIALFRSAFPKLGR